MKTILIIDADLGLLSSLEQELKQNGYHALLAATAQEGLALATQADLIIVAVELPDKNGFVVCSSLKSNIDTAHIPVFITSSASDTTAFEQHLNLANHADGYFLKPLDIATMLEEMAAIFADIEAAKAEYERQMALEAEMQSQEAFLESQSKGELEPTVDGADGDGDMIKSLTLDDASLFEDIDAGKLDDPADNLFDESGNVGDAGNVAQEATSIPRPPLPPMAGGGATPSSLPRTGLPGRLPIGGGTAIPKPAPLSPLSQKPTLGQPPASMPGGNKIPGLSRPGGSGLSPRPQSTPNSAFSKPNIPGGSRPIEPKSGVGRTVASSFTSASQTAIPAADMSRLTDEITVLKNEITALKSEITARDNRITMLQSQCDALQARTQNAEAIAETLQSEAQQIGAQFDALAMEADEKEAQLQQLMASDDQKIQEIASLKEKLNAKNEMFKELAAQMQALALD